MGSLQGIHEPRSPSGAKRIISVVKKASSQLLDGPFDCGKLLTSSASESEERLSAVLPSCVAESCLK